MDGIGADPAAWLRFLSRYTTWNRCFGSSVASLAGRIGRSREAFLDVGEPLPYLDDRSILVASFFFDAARDEFDDRDTKYRDTHRCLAQALVKGFLEVALEDGGLTLGQARGLLDEPYWLKVLQARVFAGYGEGFPVDRPFLFRGMGYHLGSELLADQEFTILDTTMRKHLPNVVEKLLGRKVKIAEQEHVAYTWLRVHSGAGNAAEADHFAWAVKGVEHALRYTPKHEEAALQEQVLKGFADFARDQVEFFENVMRS